MSFRDTFIADLPADPGEAIVTLADRAQNWMEGPSQPDDGVNSIYIQTIFKRFLERYDIGALVENTTNDDLPSVSDYVKAVTKFAGQRVVDRLLDGYDVERGEPQFGVTALTPSEKGEIHTHLDALRSIIEESRLETRKKNALYGKLNGLAKEADLDGTRTDRFFAFAGDTAFVMGEMAENAQPFLHEVKEILKIIFRSRARSEGVALPPVDEILKLSPPPEATSEV